MPPDNQRPATGTQLSASKPAPQASNPQPPAPVAQAPATKPGPQTPVSQPPAPLNANDSDGKPCAPFEKAGRSAAPGVRPYSVDQVCEPPARSFMVALRPNQPPLKLQADDPAEFVPYLKTTSLAWVNCRVADLEREGPAVAASLGFSTTLVESLLQNRHSGYEDRENELGMMLPAIRVDKLTVNGYKTFILLKDGLIFTIHGEKVVRLVRFARYADVIMRKVPVNIPMHDKLSLMLERILDENNERNFEGIRVIEEDSDEVGKMLSDPSTPMVKLSPIIYEMKHALITYLNFLWETQNVIHQLRYGDADLITDDPDILEKLEVLSEDVTRHIQLGENLSEVLASGLEVLQGIYNNQLQIINNRMALVLTWMTILGTAFLVPNTIATALGNTAYDLKPADAGWYTVMLIVSTILATVVSWWILKRKGLLPKKVD